MFRSIGVLQYGPGVRVAVNVDQGIADLYRALLPKWHPTNPQRYPAHISVVRHETPSLMEFWGRYEGEEIEFEYSTETAWDETYYWLNVRCDRLCEIRAELGLAAYPWWRNKFHITVGNKKG